MTRIGAWLHKLRGCRYNFAPLSRGPMNRYYRNCIVCGELGDERIQQLAADDIRWLEKTS